MTILEATFTDIKLAISESVAFAPNGMLLGSDLGLVAGISGSRIPSLTINFFRVSI
ncbi:hypothetical protein BMG_3276 [Priestia megaterium]|jgi:hypothetical protein|uniref:Uncharacterized protein n=1 Tax=Priestia megaterium (strain ATCC 12872 / QMB1551) TaxID=545693 RepID=D5DRR6_PRIM1|nr:hypothetical protein BMQ_2254 [Priestia megaterium QM B1551]QLK06746.1 hypothetical protein BMG_3276 [Priestia megaterium]